MVQIRIRFLTQVRQESSFLLGAKMPQNKVCKICGTQIGSAQDLKVSL